MTLANDLLGFPEEKKAEIIRLVAQDRPPPKWIRFVGGAIHSRAWLEWYRQRGLRNPEEGRRCHVPEKVRQAVILRDRFICGICGGHVERPDVHLDHIVPFSMGGESSEENLRVTHSKCNMRKGAREK